jgi:antitoxin component YwqK of YwqJK toxin-antitoxin module
MKTIYFLIALFFSDTLFAQDIREVKDYYESGNLYSTGYYKRIDSISESSYGLWTYWYENGQKMLEEIQSDPITKYINFWTSSGLQLLKNGEGKMFEAAQFTGDDSSIFIIKDSLKHGNYVSFIPTKNGMRLFAEGIYINGLRNGIVYYYSDSGKISETNNYIKDEENGLHVEYYDNGIPKEIGIRHEYRKSGIWGYFTEEGNLTKEETYEKGYKIYVVEYYPNCSKKSEGAFITLSYKEKKNNKSVRDNSYPTTRRSTKRTTRTNIKQGVWIYYNSKGEINKKEKYDKGIPKKNGM